ncbi:hypothetical protein [Muricoccus radiodurans]|uniref:hypothetical protein n=1 Tax=Muricoccus radiodurans TaxID=2231721 RepID=UPI003CE816C0
MRGAMMAAAVLTGLALAGPAAAQRTGAYSVTGTNPDGSSYDGDLLMRQVGLSSWQVRWQVGGNRFEGYGMSSGTTFAIGFTLGDRPGVAIYTILPDGSLTGQWTLIGSSAIGTETLTPAAMPGPAPAAPTPAPAR